MKLFNQLVMLQMMCGVVREQTLIQTNYYGTYRFQANTLDKRNKQ